MTQAQSTWDNGDPEPPEVSRTYQYDRNGNRLFEHRVTPEIPDETGAAVDLQFTHQIDPLSNRLRKMDNGGSRDITIDDPATPEIEGYDDLGNVTQIVKNNEEGVQITQTLAYEHPLHPILPTTIRQRAYTTDGNSLPVVDEWFDVSYTYNAAGARTSRLRTAYVADENGDPVAQPARRDYFLPFGTENLAEMDTHGRLTRAYLFAGDERIGFKSETDTGLYVKDHLGSTKSVLRIYRDDVQNLAQPNLWLQPGTPAHHWPLDGDLLDLTNGASASLQGGGSSAYVTGVAEQALQLDGAGDYLDLGSPALFTDDADFFTLAMWVRVDQDLTAANATYSLFSNRDGATGGMALLLESNTNGTASGTLTLYTYQTDGSDFIKTTTGNHFPNDQQWHYLVITQQGNLGTLYLDGNPLVEGDLDPPDPSGNTLKLGANHSGSGQYLPGTLDEVVIYQGALALTDIQKAYYVAAASLQSSFPQGGLTAFYELDGDLADAAGIQAAGQMTGDPTYTSGVVGESLVFDGVDDGVDLGNPAGFGSQVGDFSVSLWVKLGVGLDFENRLVPLLSNVQNNAGMELQLKLHPDPAQHGILYFTTYQNGGYTRLWTDAGAFPNDGAWHHIAATRQGASGKLYLDGVLVDGKNSGHSGRCPGKPAVGPGPCRQAMAGLPGPG